MYGSDGLYLHAKRIVLQPSLRLRSEKMYVVSLRSDGYTFTAFAGKNFLGGCDCLTGCVAGGCICIDTGRECTPEDCRRKK